MPVIAMAQTAADCNHRIAELLAEMDSDPVFIVYWARLTGRFVDATPGTLAQLLQDSLLAEIHLVAVSQTVRHRISGLEAAAALFGVFGSDYLVLGAHTLGVSPCELVSLLERDEISSPLQKLIAAMVANARPFAENHLIEAVERIDLMLPVEGDPDGIELPQLGQLELTAG
ncbi:MAG: hypothetical protein AAFY56_15935 [Pseudomonadota bacterium]